MLDVLSLWLTSNWLTNLAIGLVALLCLLYRYGTYNHGYWKKRGLRSPPSLPFVGNLFSFTTPMPLLHLEYVKQYGKFFGVLQGNKPLLFLTDPVVLKRVLVQDFHVFKNRSNGAARHPVMAKNLVVARSEEWKRIRSILTPMFTSSKLRRMEPLMDGCVSSLIAALDRVADREGSFPVHNLMGNFTMDVIAKCAFATDTNPYGTGENLFVRSAKAALEFKFIRLLLFSLIPKRVLEFLVNRKTPYIYQEHMDFFQTISKHLIDGRRSEGKYADDMLQLMVKAEHNREKSYDKEDLMDMHHVNASAEEIATEQKVLQEIIGSKYLSEEEIMAQMMVFFLAGYETTASTLTFCMYELATNPAIQHRLYAELKAASKQDPSLSYSTLMKLPYLDAVISETLRKHPPALLLSREAAERYHIKEYDYTLEPGDAIITPVYAMHHLEANFPKPEQFSPERFMGENRDRITPYTYIPFGGGPRNCIGMRFALSEAKLGLAQIITRYELFQSNQTPSTLDVKQSLVILKTTPVWVGIRHRGVKA